MEENRIPTGAKWEKSDEMLLGYSSKENTMIFMKQECSGTSAALPWSSLKSGSWVQVSGAHVLC